MPNVYTRTGDSGDTGLFGGSRVGKDAPRVEAYGTVDEANAAVGLAKAQLPEGELRDTVHHIQQRMFVLAAELASDARGQQTLAGRVDDADVDDLEHVIDRCLAVTGPQRFFVVPGRDPLSAQFHVARTVVRRAERRMLTLSHEEPVRPVLIKYVNRLSDAVYALARLAEHQADLRRIEQIVRGAVAQALQAAPVGDLAVFDLRTAETMAAAAQRRADEIGVPIVFAAVDEAGQLMLLHRMPDSLLVSLDLAQGKAFTAAALRRPTEQLKADAVESGALFGLTASNQGRIVVFGGGLPVFVDGRLAGGIGVSGGAVEQDIDIVGYAMRTAIGG